MQGNLSGVEAPSVDVNSAESLDDLIATFEDLYEKINHPLVNIQRRAMKNYEKTSLCRGIGNDVASS